MAVNMEDIRRLYRAEPFLPFDLELEDGRRVRVHGRDLIALSPTGDTIFVGQPDDKSELIQLNRVRAIHETTWKASA